MLTALLDTLANPYALVIAGGSLALCVGALLFILADARQAPLLTVDELCPDCYGTRVVVSHTGMGREISYACKTCQPGRAA